MIAEAMGARSMHFLKKLNIVSFLSVVRMKLGKLVSFGSDLGPNLPRCQETHYAVDQNLLKEKILIKIFTISFAVTIDDKINLLGFNAEASAIVSSKDPITIHAAILNYY
jgi:hypothetical protein